MHTVFFNVFLCLFLLTQSLLASNKSYNEPFNYLGYIPVEKPAFLYLVPNGANSTSLLITHFKVFGNGRVTAVHRIGDHLKSLEQTQVEIWNTTTAWPNEIQPVPEEIFGPHHFSVAGGFLVPGKANGSVKIFRCEIPDTSLQDLCTQYSEAEPADITISKRGWWYHRVEWVDMNADGLLDMVTARARKPIFGGGMGELVWMEQPENPRQMPWQEHFIGKGPDVHFLVEDLNHDGQVEILSTEFFQEKLSLFYLENGIWTYKIIDENLGAGFDLSLSDLNNDSKLDILATNHQADASASIFAYELPQNPLQDQWKRRVLLTGIETRNKGQGQGSPGSAFAFFPNTKSKNQKPLILASGDGSQRVHFLRPVSEDPHNWEYAESILLDVGSTVGQIAIGDVDLDGFVEVFIPAYDAGRIEVFTTRQP